MRGRPERYNWAVRRRPLGQNVTLTYIIEEGRRAWWELAGKVADSPQKSEARLRTQAVGAG